jgi:integrase/recombinase XerD
MINRENYHLVKKYLDYRDRVMQNDPQTVRHAWVTLRHLLEWADDRPFTKSNAIHNIFPDYLLKARNDGKSAQLSPGHMTKILSFTRDFFDWAKREYHHEFRGISTSWIDSLQVRRSKRAGSRLVRRQFWTLEDVKKVLAIPAETLRVKRDKAALAFIYLSAMRGGAFVTLPIEAVDIANKRIQQLPELGVKTKNSKAAITTLLPIPDLLEVAAEWDAHVRSIAVNGQVPWYPRLSSDGMKIMADDQINEVQITGRRSALYSGLQELCQLAGIEWKSPHKIRHGHGVYGVKHAKTMAEFKAFSQNMMHDTVVTTDKTYGRLAEEDIADIIGTFTD